VDVDAENVLKWGHYCYGYGYATPAVSPAGMLYLSEKSWLVFSPPDRRIASQIAVAEISRQRAEYGQYQRSLAVRKKST